LKIEIKSEIDRFKSHLDLIDNSQIIFSGIFGIGKTYFLKEFFESKKDEYETFLLSPVNYSISQNDDIIDYIKYDIVFQLLNKNIDFEKTDFSELLTAQFYLKENFLETIALLAKNGGKIGKAFSDVYENLKELINNIKKHNAEVQIDEQMELIDFLKEVTSRDNSIYEENRITELIYGLIEKLKESKKEIVLIIDDLDRLDPEHIFRILNVFACHFDIPNFTANKFGFHKVILVCDIENIRNLFHSKYGMNVDFSGYIDKFYSREIFCYNNKEVVNQSINKILGLIQFEGSFDHIINFKDPRHRSTQDFHEILEDLVNNDLMNLRTLLKLADKQYKFNFFQFRMDENNTRSSSWHWKKILIFDFLVAFYGSVNSVKNALVKLSERNPSKIVDKYDFRRFGNLITLLDYKNHKNNDGEHSYKNINLNLLVTYSIRRYGESYEEVSSDIISINYLDSPDINRFDFPFSQLLYLAFIEYINLNRIRN